MTNVTVEVRGIPKIMQGLTVLGAEAPKAVAKGMVEWAEETMGESKEKYCPVVEGTLRGTGHVTTPHITAATILVRLGYGGPAAEYALAVHENPRAGKTGGISPQGKKYRAWSTVGQWKYLETPVKLNEPEAGPTILKWVNRAIRRLAK